ncbi:hypothetical protein HOLleu_18792 [Holothuria leucospilota]|uniref:Uncharacterized protein n=1 Tax=Holothuria leucospilota TaxID=206669 RepID=A0A9Q1C489_HOLLE|nr:hypothetical protein HOLleu_18792 [Holothuria leucospilota]
MVQKTKSAARVSPTPAPAEGPPKPSTPGDEVTEEARKLLWMYKMALVNNLQPFEMIKHLRENMVINAERAKELRREGRGNKHATGEAVIGELMTRGKREFDVFVFGLKKQNINLLADLLEEKHESKLINILEPASKKLGHHWKRLSLELGTAGFVPKIETKYSRIREQALYSLLLWEDSSGISATERRLLDGLQALQMKWALAHLRKLSNPKSGKKKKGKKKSGKKKK